MMFLVTLSAGLCRVLSMIGGAAVVLMMVHICLDVALLNLFDVSMNTTPDIVARYYMVAIAFLPLGWVTLQRQMIAVEVLDAVLPTAARRILDVLIGVIGTSIYGLVTYATWGKALAEMRSGSFVDLVSVQMPVWQSHFLVPAGFALATLACALMTVAHLVPRAGEALAARPPDDPR